MYIRFLLMLMCLIKLSTFVLAGGHGGGHKKVIIHVPMYIKHHHHKHTIVKHIHHKGKGGGDDEDKYEVLGYTYGEPKSSHKFGGGHGWSAAEEDHDGTEHLEADHSYAGSL